MKNFIKKMLRMLLLFPVFLLGTKPDINITVKNSAVGETNFTDVAAQVALGSLIAGAVIAVGTLIGKAISDAYSPESYYKSAKNLYNPIRIDSVITSPSETPFEFEQLILQSLSWRNYSWNIDTSDCYLYVSAQKLDDYLNSLEKALEYCETAHEKSIKESYNKKHSKSFITKKSEKLKKKIKLMIEIIGQKIQLCQYHPLYETHARIYLKKKELKEAREHAKAVEWQMRQQTWEMQKQTEVIKNQQKTPAVDITIINK